MSWRIPRGAAAVISTLRLSGARPELGALPETEWRNALAFADRMRLTLLFERALGPDAPPWVRARLDANLADQARRNQALHRAFAEVAGVLEQAGIEFLVLKGFAHASDFGPDPERRVQYDLDLFCPEAVRAREALRPLGYEPMADMERFPTDHLPNLVRKTGWEWRGNFFDPELPLSIDLHFRFWDENTERMALPGLDEFWARRERRRLGGVLFQALDPADALAYSALHALRHLLRGNLSAHHVYEIAWFLDHRPRDQEFWARWGSLHAPRLRAVQAILFRLAEEWFGCAMHPAARQEAEALAPDVAWWFERFAASPVEALFHPNKDELWLHLSLAETSADRRRVALRRLFPATLPGPVAAVHVPAERAGPAIRARAKIRYAAYLAQRAAFHTRAALPVVAHGMAWAGRRNGLPQSYWSFLAASALFNLGVFVFVLLYNLLLLERGYREDFLGLVSSLGTAGSVAATLPAAVLARRLGLRRTLLLGFLATAGISAARSVVAGSAALLALAFAGGAALALWPVSIAPVIAGLAPERSRPLAFSLFFATGIAMGIAGGVAGGALPGWVGSKQAALLVGCGISALAAPLAARLTFAKAPAEPPLTYPWSPWMARYLAALAVWNLATGAFNPFFNAYFAHGLHMGVERIGAAFSAAQVAQVGALLLAPVVLRRSGLIRGIAGMQAATGVALAGLAVAPAALAPAVYAAYMSFQYMSEPGLNSVLMKGVEPEQRAGASSLNYLVVFFAQAAAATAAGIALARFGYAPVLSAAAIVALLGALLFRGMLGGSAR